MAEAKEQFMEDVRGYIEMGERLIAGVTAFNEMNSAALEDLEGGMTLTESFAKRDSAYWSRRISSLVEGYEECRRRTRESAALALVEEGHSVSFVAQAFGTTRQWASRLLKGARLAAEAPGAPGSGGDVLPATGPDRPPA